MNDLTTDGYIGREVETTSGDLFNTLSFLVNQVISGKWTVTLGLVKSVMGGGIAAPPLVSVQPMVNQTDGQGNPTPHGIINNVPAFRLQGGTGAIIADPVVGDIGLLACAMSDISAVKQTNAPANPGSFQNVLAFRCDVFRCDARRNAKAICADHAYRDRHFGRNHDGNGQL